MSKELTLFRLTYDEEVNAVYIYPRAAHNYFDRKVHKTRKVPGYPNVYLDINKDGDVLGLEILNPNDISIYNALKLLTKETKDLAFEEEEE